MRARGEVIEVNNHGDMVSVVAQCKFGKAPAWQSFHKVSFFVPPHLAKAYYIGRHVVLEVGVRP